MDNEEAYIVRCGQPKANGELCKRIVYNTLASISVSAQKLLVAEFGGPSCSVHKTSENTKVWKILRSVASESWSAGYHAGEKSGRLDLLNEQRNAAREADRAANFRLYDVDGSQIVEVGNYAYKWRGDSKLQAGDSVILPGNWFDARPREAKVTSLGSSYVGMLSVITRRA